MNELQSLTVDPALSVVSRVALSLLFLWAAAHKLRDVAAFRAAVSAYRLLPGALSDVASLTLIAAEAAVGVMLITSSSVVPAFGAAALLVLYSGAIAINLERGNRVDCGCAGPAGRRPLSGGLLARNALLLALALVAALPSAARAFVWIDALTIGGGGLALVLLYATVDTLLANSSHVIQASKRLCTRSRYGGTVIPANAGIQVGRWGRIVDSRVRGNDDSQFSGLYVQSPSKPASPQPQINLAVHP